MVETRSACALVRCDACGLEHKDIRVTLDTFFHLPELIDHRCQLGACIGCLFIAVEAMDVIEECGHIGCDAVDFYFPCITERFVGVCIDKGCGFRGIDRAILEKASNISDECFVPATHITRDGCTDLLLFFFRERGALLHVLCVLACHRPLL